MIIAVDFDGTIVEHKYPQIGKEIPFAVITIKKLMEDGHKLILWSVREGKHLDAAVEWCHERGIHFTSINGFLDEDNLDNFQQERTDNPSFSRKLKVDCFIDDRNVGGLPDWRIIYQLISKKMTYEQYMEQQFSEEPMEKKKKKPWWKF